jgi:hypothetical protein
MTHCACEQHCGHEFDAEPDRGHRLLCGDSTVATDVARALRGKAALCLTDPPYGLGGTSSVKNDYIEYEDSRDNLVRLIEGFLPLAQVLREAAAIATQNAGPWLAADRHATRAGALNGLGRFE